MTPTAPSTKTDSPLSKSSQLTFSWVLIIYDLLQSEKSSSDRSSGHLNGEYYGINYILIENFMSNIWTVFHRFFSFFWVLLLLEFDNQSLLSCSLIVKFS